MVEASGTNAGSIDDGTISTSDGDRSRKLFRAMKVFDIVLAMTGGNYNTTVLAQTFYLEYFIYGNTGKAMAAVVLLILAIIPVMVYQVRHYRKFEAAR
jgi:alpha-glucoside transport system permease protein